MTSVINQIIELWSYIIFYNIKSSNYKNNKNKQVNDLSSCFLILNLCSSFLLGYSAIINRNTQFIIVNSVSIFQTFILLLLKNFMKIIQYYL